MVAGGSREGTASLLVAAFEAVAEAPAVGAGVDDVRAVGDPVNDGFRHPRVGEHLRPFSERQVGRDDQRSAFVALGDDLEHELGGTLRQRQISQLVEDHDLGPGVAANDPGELAA